MALRNVKDYNKIQMEVNEALADFAKGLTENPNLFKEYERKLQENIQGNKGLKDISASWQQRIKNSLPDVIRDIAPSTSEGIGLGIDAISALSQLLMIRHVFKGKGVPGVGRMGKIFKSTTDVVEDMSEAASISRATKFIDTGGGASKALNAAGKLTNFGTYGTVAAMVAVPAIMGYDAFSNLSKSQDRREVIEKEVRAKYAGHAIQPSKEEQEQLQKEKDKLVKDLTAVGWKPDMALQMANKQFNKTTPTESLIKSEINSRMEAEQAAAKADAAKEEEAKNRSTIDLYIHTDDGNVERQTIDGGGRAAIDFFTASSSTIPVYNGAR
jgi:hypothetical protein